ncbi:tetratricopeptide repeat protein [Telluribacter humicola]|uniref:tetratricopeptide repeat protein n=1 Tax=Telluribacter humicola TaxID=1720261 RepID=UPI001A97C4A4|nr:tetratricopeptide repeat protein [Telluribacter humicola]
MKANLYLIAILLLLSLLTQAQSAEDYFASGLDKKDRKAYSEALKDFSQVIELTPEDALAYMYRGACYLMLDKPEEALADLTKSIALNPDYAETYNYRGQCLYKLDKAQEAILDYTKAIELELDFADPYTNRGRSLFKVEKYQDALHDYNIAITLEPERADVYIYRGDCLAKLKHYQEAIHDYKRAIELQPDLSEAKARLDQLQEEEANRPIPKFWIVAVGIDTYLSKNLNPLNSSVTNIFKFRDIFLSANLSKRAQIETLANKNANREKILSTIKNKLCDPKQVSPDDIIIFYFVGHGTILDENSFGVCPYDYQKANKLISEAEIVNQLQTSPARTRLCLIESCKSKIITMGSSISQEALEQFNERRKQYNATTVVLTSTKVGEPSYEDHTLGGYFSYFLQQGLQGKADGYGTNQKDKFVSTRELYLYVKDKVLEESGGEQEPQINLPAFEADIPIIPVIE